MKKFRSKKDPLMILPVAAFVLLPAAVFFGDMAEVREHPLVILPLLAPLALLLWVVFDTYYVIDGQKLRYHSAFVRGEVDIGKIREIVKGKTLWIGVKPALARNGLIIRFNSYDEIYISPEDQDEMIADLIDINRDIRVK